VTAVVTRVLSARQVETRRRLLAAGTSLAERSGLDGFTMRDVAEEAGVVPATAYAYFASKEHLLAEVFATWIERLTQAIHDDPPAGRTSVARVQEVFARAVAAIGESPGLAVAFITAMASSDPSAQTITPRVQASFTSWLDLALGPGAFADRAPLVWTLQLAMFASLITYAHGQLTLAELDTTLADAARLLVNGAMR
jgi:AcrR family transcriptional regulator